MEDSPLKIGIVDDDSDYLEKLTKTLVPVVGDIFLTSTDFKDALTWVEEGKINILISDKKMPLIDGVSLLEKVQKKNNDISLALLTNYSVDLKDIDRLDKINAELFSKHDSDEGGVNDKIIYFVNNYFFITRINKLNNRLKENNSAKVVRIMSLNYILLFALSILSYYYFQYQIFDVFLAKIGVFVAIGFFAMSYIVQRQIKSTRKD